MSRRNLLNQKLKKLIKFNFFDLLIDSFDPIFDFFDLLIKNRSILIKNMLILIKNRSIFNRSNTHTIRYDIVSGFWIRPKSKFEFGRLVRFVGSHPLSLLTAWQLFFKCDQSKWLFNGIVVHNIHALLDFRKLSNFEKYLIICHIKLNI